MTSLLVLWQMTPRSLSRTLYHIEGEIDTFAFQSWGYFAYRCKEPSGFPFNQISITPTEERKRIRFVAGSSVFFKTSIFLLELQVINHPYMF